MFALLESVWNLLQYPYDITHRHIATLPWEIKNSNFLQIFSRYGRKSKQIEFLIAFNFASRSPYRLQIQFFSSLLFYLFTFAISLWHQKFITSDVTAVFVNNQHGIQQRGQDFDKNFICSQNGERLAILNIENIKICGWITKLEAIKMQFVRISAMSAEYLQNIWIFKFSR